METKRAQHGQSVVVESHRGYTDTKFVQTANIICINYNVIKSIGIYLQIFLEKLQLSLNMWNGYFFCERFSIDTSYSITSRNNKELVKNLSTSPPGSSDLYFPMQFAQNDWEQFKSCLWKQNLSYWRSPSYNLTRITEAFVLSLLLGVIYWNQGKEM